MVLRSTTAQITSNGSTFRIPGERYVHTPRNEVPARGRGGCRPASIVVRRFCEVDLMLDAARRVPCQHATVAQILANAEG